MRSVLRALPSCPAGPPGRVEQRRDMIRSMASNVSALSGIVANGHQPIHSFPLPPLKFRTVGFPQYGFKRAVNRALRRLAATLTPAQWRSLPCALDSVVGPSPKRHAQLLTPHTRPVALGSASGYAVRRPPRLLWPHPSFCQPPPVYGLIPVASPADRRSPIYSARAWFRAAVSTPVAPGRRRRVCAPGLAFTHPVRVRQPHFPTFRIPWGPLTKRQHSLDAAARNLACPAPDGTFTTELANAESLRRPSVITT